MKTTMMFVFASLISTSAFASAQKVSCWLDYSKHGATGESIESARSVIGTLESGDLKRELNGFVLKARLREICPAGFGSRCSGAYQLSTTLSRGNVSTYGQVPTPFSRHAQILSIETESVALICDMEQ